LSDQSGAHHGRGARSALQYAVQAAGDTAYEWDLVADTVVWHGPADSFFHGDIPNTGARFSALLHPEDLAERTRSLNEHAAHGRPHDCEYRLRGPGGSYQWVHERGATLESGAQTLYGTLRLVTARKRNEKRLEYLVNHDELTGHFNKVRLRQAVDQALSEALRFGTSGAFAIFGVDQLAMINSAYGHEAGDSVLVAVGKRLSGCLRGSDVIGRVGGDRFGVLLSRCAREEAWRAAERVIETVRAEPVETTAGPVRITLTGGVVVFPEQAGSSHDILAKAEGALRHAKRTGRNRTGLYEISEAQQQSFRSSLDLGAEIEAALRERRLIFAYQPIVRPQDKTPAFHECLLRMKRPDGEIVSAGRFVPVVEELGLMRALDRQVLDEAVAELRAAPKAEMAINISGLTAADDSWLRALIGHLDGRTDIARRLIIEITETAALQDIDDTARFVAAVRRLGCRVAVDDFGAGFTNFRHLKTLTVDIVKIDGSFVRGIDQEPQNRLFVRNLISLAGSMGLVTVAECVETAEEAQILTEEGADMLQGYYFARPSLETPWPKETEAEPEAQVEVARPRRA